MSHALRAKTVASARPLDALEMEIVISATITSACAEIARRLDALEAGSPTTLDPTLDAPALGNMVLGTIARLRARGLIHSDFENWWDDVVCCTAEAGMAPLVLRVETLRRRLFARELKDKLAEAFKG